MREEESTNTVAFETGLKWMRVFGISGLVAALGFGSATIYTILTKSYTLSPVTSPLFGIYCLTFLTLPGSFIFLASRHRALLVQHRKRVVQSGLSWFLAAQLSFVTLGGYAAYLVQQIKPY